MTRRLGGREFDPGGLTQFEAWALFLAAVEQQDPEVLAELKEKVLPLVPEEYTKLPFYLCVRPELWNDLEALREFYPEYYPAGEALHKWADKYNLNDPWLLEAVGSTLGEMKKCGTAGFVLSSETYWGIPKEPINWDPVEETRAAFERRIKEYMDQQEASAWRMGWEPTPEKRNLEHFSWLVRYQVQGWSMRQIADYYSKEDRILTENTIAKGIRQAAKLVGLKLRPQHKGGRPKEK